MTTDRIETDTSHRASTWLLYMAFLLAFGALYVCTAQSGPAWQDSGVYQERILDFDLSTSRGIALAHPLMILLGKAFSYLPFGTIFWRMNLVSALAGAMAVANVAVFVKRIQPDRLLPAVIAGLTFGLAHTVWWLSTICESQMLNVAFLTLNLNLLLGLYRRPDGVLAMLIGLVAGLGAATHDLALLSLPSLGLVLLWLCFGRRLSWRGVGLVVIGWLIGASGLLLLIAFEAARSGLWAAISSALFGQRWGDNVVKGSLSALKNGPLCVLLNFPNLALPLMVVGLAAMRRVLGSPLAWAIGLMTALYFLFAVRYSVSDQFMFFTPFYAMAGILAGLGFARLTEAGARRWLGLVAVILLLATPAIYSLLPSITQKLGITVPGRTDIVFRDSPRYWLVPWKNNEDSAGQFARTAMRQIPSDSIIILDSTTFYAVDMIRRLEFPTKDVRLVIMGKGSQMDAIPVGTPNVYLDSARPGYHEEWMDKFAAYDRPPGQALFLVVWNEK